MIRKSCAIATSFQMPVFVMMAVVLWASVSVPAKSWGQETDVEESTDADKSTDAAEKAPAEAPPEKPSAADSSQKDAKDQAASEADRYKAVEVEIPKPIDVDKAVVNYPRAVALDGDDLLIVDLDLPGIWKRSGDESVVHTPGTKLLRKPMNRPWCVTSHPEGGILIGDSATREIYHAKEQGAQLVALNGGYLGIPMAIAVDPEGQSIYVGDAERRAVFRLPIGGGKPELVARVNARGLSFDDEGKLWAVTPDAEAVQRIDVQKNSAEVIVDGRPYQFPNGIVWAGEEGFVADGYGKSIWKFTADGKTEKWHEGEPLQGPVGMTADEDSLYVADPKTKQVYQFDRKSKEAKPLL